VAGTYTALFPIGYGIDRQSAGFTPFSGNGGTVLGSHLVRFARSDSDFFEEG